MGKHVLTIVVALVIAFTLLLYLFTFQVRSNQVAIVLRFGAPVKLPEPGFHVRLPWPIHEVRRFDNRLHVHEGRLEELPTRDRHNIIMSYCVGWRIIDGGVETFNKTFGSVEDPIAAAWSRLEQITRDRMGVVMGQHDLKALVTVDPEQLKYDEIEASAAAECSRLAKDYGMEVELFKIKRLELPQSVTQNIYERMKAERLKEASEISENALQVASTIRSNANAERDQIVSRARAVAKSIIAEGEAQAAEFYGVFAKNPELAIFLKKVEALNATTASGTTLIIDTGTSPFDLLKSGPPSISK